ncbi:MAG: hypothetical protein M1813_000949 [Trichoglossum hirsutum]|jgi:hypothetical protein|nr:MAG: hypothetical protein M1813_000949 [Trichoglossum hirsutum]
MAIFRTLTAAAALLLLFFSSTTLADFHLMSHVTIGGRWNGDYTYYALVAMPSKVWKCNGEGGKVVDGDTFPATFKSRIPVCGQWLEFKQRAAGGYDLYWGEKYWGWCKQQGQGKFPYDIGCSVLPFYSDGYSDQYVCFTSICD